jgi:ABC-type bacteriocin/lantibiotic exporter with double-glycine peptidase domain
MKLEGHNVTLKQVKELVPLDPVRGCSMETLIYASKKLGFPVKARFVKSGELSKVPRPFILHGITSQEKNLGHFIVVVDYDKKKKIYTLIDPIRETFTRNPESSLLYGYSEYILIPQYSSSKKWNTITGCSLILCGLGILVIMIQRIYPNLFFFKISLLKKNDKESSE